MAKLYFKFGAMGSSKTAQALMVKFNYEEKGQSVWLIKPSTDTRDNKIGENGEVKTILMSRIGLSCEAEALDSTVDIYKEFKKRSANGKYRDVIICDESQFLTRRQVSELKELACREDIPVLCFGLSTDFQTKLFPGSMRLFEIADSITEIKSVCKCGRKATVNARFDSTGKIIAKGEQVFLGGNDSYIGMCYNCYKKQIEDTYGEDVANEILFK